MDKFLPLELPDTELLLEGLQLLARFIGNRLSGQDSNYGGEEDLRRIYSLYRRLNELGGIQNSLRDFQLEYWDYKYLLDGIELLDADIRDRGLSEQTAPELSRLQVLHARVFVDAKLEPS